MLAYKGIPHLKFPIHCLGTKPYFNHALFKKTLDIMNILDKIFGNWWLGMHLFSLHASI